MCALLYVKQKTNKDLLCSPGNSTQYVGESEEKYIYVHIYTHTYTCTYIYINTHIHIMSASFYLSLFFHIMCTSFYIPYLGGLDVFNRVSTSFHPHNTPILVPKQLTHSSHMQCCPLCQKNFSSSFPYLSRAHSPELGPLMLHCNF